MTMGVLCNIQEVSEAYTAATQLEVLPRGWAGDAPGWASISPKTLSRKKTVNNNVNMSILARNHHPLHRRLVTEASALEGLPSTLGEPRPGGAHGRAPVLLPRPPPPPNQVWIYNSFHGDIWLISLKPFFLLLYLSSKLISFQFNSMSSVFSL